jgi:hypothetical protein
VSVAARSLSDYLRRFRPVATPGAAAPAGVPSDVVAALQAELAPVFEALGDAQREAARIRDEARARSHEIARAALVEAASIEASGRRDAARARSEASSERAQLAEAERRQLLAAGEAEAARIDARVAQRMPGMVDRVVDGVLRVERSPMGHADATGSKP